MGSFDRPKKQRIHQWKKTAFHFSLCFVMGFFIGFAPTSTSTPYPSLHNLGITAKPSEKIQKSVHVNPNTIPKMPSNPLPMAEDEDDTNANEPSRDLLIIVTPVHSNDVFQMPLLRRLSNALKLVSAPLVWIVVERKRDAVRTAEVLRRTGVMYRHLTYSDNFTDFEAEIEHQRNVALNHVEAHRLNGIVHFADVYNAYDLEFFEEIREIDAFGAWPVVTVSANRKPVIVQGPVCSSSKVVGWQSRDVSDKNNGSTTEKPSKINIFGFAFNSSILWDPERWGRSSSVPDISQDSVKFVQEVILEDETKLRAIPNDCSKLMLWNLQIPMLQTQDHRERN